MRNSHEKRRVTNSHEMRQGSARLTDSLVRFLAAVQMQAIATFNTLNQEGRSVAVALVSRSPMTRDDASLYTQSPLLSAADRRLQRLLARDYTTTDAHKLLTTGDGGPTHGDEEDEAAATAAASPGPAASGAAEESSFVGTSQRLAVQYGYPGALPTDVPVVDAEAAGRLAASLTRPQTAEDLAAARQRRASRRSAAASIDDRKSGR